MSVHYLKGQTFHINCETLCIASLIMVNNYRVYTVKITSETPLIFAVNGRSLDLKIKMEILFLVLDITKFRLGPL